LKKSWELLATAFDAEARENIIEWTYLRESTLKEIQPDKGREQQKIFADEQGTCFRAK
jgi:hypothetical protein